MDEFKTKIDFGKIGLAINKIRRSKGLEVKDIALSMGLHRSTINNAENGRPISLTTLLMICEALEVTVDEILREANISPIYDNDELLNRVILYEIQECDFDTKNEILEIIRVIKECHSHKK